MTSDSLQPNKGLVLRAPTGGTIPRRWAARNRGQGLAATARRDGTWQGHDRVPATRAATTVKRERRHTKPRGNQDERRQFCEEGDR